MFKHIPLQFFVAFGPVGGNGLPFKANIVQQLDSQSIQLRLFPLASKFVLPALAANPLPQKPESRRRKVRFMISGP